MSGTTALTQECNALLLSDGKKSDYIQETIPAKFLESCKKYPEKPALIYKKDHTFGYVQYKRLLNLVENFTLSLEKLGVKEGDRIAILSENRPEWAVCDLSTISLGAIFVPIHAALAPDQIKEIIFETSPKIIVVSEKRLLSKLIEIKKQIDKNITIVYYNIELKEDLSELKNEKCHFIEVLKLIDYHEISNYRYKKLIQKVNANNTANILYTIGPNGKYRGVELSHKNLLSNIKGAGAAIIPKIDDRFLSVLPLSHAFEKTIGFYLPLVYGCQIIYMPELSELAKTFKKRKPTVIIGVPRLYEKSYQRIEEQFNKNKITRFFFDKAILHNQNIMLTNWVYNLTVYRNVRKAFGGKIRLLASGGAALKPKIGSFLTKSGMPVLEGYGLTELSPVVAVNRLEQNKIGTVGLPLPNTHVKIADDGEILVKGPGLMKGYYRNGAGPELYLEKGWFKTGDLGELDEEGFLKIIGRKKEIIIISTGKNISPRIIEEQLSQSKYIRQAVVVGDDSYKHIVALIVPHFIKLQKKFWLKSKQAVVNSKEVKEFLQEEIDNQLKDFPSHEQIKKFALVSTAFTTENHFLNQDLSLNRDKINVVYQEVMDNLYN